MLYTAKIKRQDSIVIAVVSLIGPPAGLVLNFETWWILLAFSRVVDD